MVPPNFQPSTHTQTHSQLREREKKLLHKKGYRNLLKTNSVIRKSSLKFNALKIMLKIFAAFWMLLPKLFFFSFLPNV